MGWFWKTKREKQLEAQLQTARDEASSNWGARMTAESNLKKVEKERDTAQESLSTMSARVEALSNERDAERKAKEAAMDKAVQMEGKRDQYKRERDEARTERDAERKVKQGAEKERDKVRGQLDAVVKVRDGALADVERLTEKRDWWQKRAENALKSAEKRKKEIDALKVDQRDKDALCDEKSELRQQVENLESELEHRTEAATTAAAEKRSLIADRDGLREEKDKQDTQNGLLHKRIKTLLEEKEAQRVELARLRDKEANRPVVEVELREGVQGPKRVPCFRYRAVNAGSDVVAVSAPQGVPTRDRVEKRIGLLSDARWVIYKVVGKDGKVSYPKEDGDV